MKKLSWLVRKTWKTILGAKGTRSSKEFRENKKEVLAHSVVENVRGVLTNQNKFSETEENSKTFKFLKECTELYHKSINEFIGLNSAASIEAEKGLEIIMKKIEPDYLLKRSLKQLKKISDQIEDFIAFIGDCIEEETAFLLKKVSELEKLISQEGQDSSSSKVQIDAEQAIAFFTKRCSLHREIVVNGMLGSYSLVAQENKKFVNFFIHNPVFKPENMIPFQGVQRGILEAAQELEYSIQKARGLLSEEEEKQRDFVILLATRLSPTYASL